MTDDDLNDLERKTLNELKAIAAKYGVTSWDLVGRADRRASWLRILNDIRTDQESFKKWSQERELF